jgi:hypothetical protein
LFLLRAKGSAMPVLLFLAAAAAPAIVAPHCFFSHSFLSEFQMWKRFCFPSVESVNFGASEQAQQV